MVEEGYADNHMVPQSHFTEIAQQKWFPAMNVTGSNETLEQDPSAEISFEGENSSNAILEGISDFDENSENRTSYSEEPSHGTYSG